MNENIFKIVQMLSLLDMSDEIEQIEKDLAYHKDLFVGIENALQNKVMEDMSNGHYEKLSSYQNVLSTVHKYVESLDKINYRNASICPIDCKPIETQNVLCTTMDENVSFTSPVSVELSGITYRLEYKTWIGVVQIIFETLSALNPSLFKRFVDMINMEGKTYCKFFTADESENRGANISYLPGVDLYFSLAGDANSMAKLGFRALKMFNLEKECRVQYIPKQKNENN